MAAPENVTYSQKLMYDRINDFFRRDGGQHPGFEELQVAPPATFIPSKYDNGVRWVSRLGVTNDGVDWAFVSTAATGAEYKTKATAHEALLSELVTLIDRQEYNKKATVLFRHELRIPRYRLDPQDPKYLENPSAPEDTKFGDLQFAMRKLQMLDMPYVLFGKLYAKTLATNLERKFANVLIDLLEAFSKGLTTQTEKVLMQRISERDASKNRNPYPHFQYRLAPHEKQDIQAVADAMYACVITDQVDLTPEGVKGNAGVLGEAAGHALADVTFEVGMRFNHTLRNEMKRLLKERKEREEVLGDGLRDTGMKGM